MIDIVPPAPFGTAGKTQSGEPVKAAKTALLLDNAFIGRVYKSMLWFGLIVCFLMAFVFKTAPAIGSFVGGYVLAVILLRLHEVTIRGILRPQSELGGFDPRLLVALLLPIKFVFVGALLVGWNLTGTLQPAPLAAGFFACQLVIVAKVAGLLLAKKTA